MIDCPVIQILMATYNGEKYIRRQIDSIVDQKYTKWNLLVRDDGSQDGTVSILDEYSARDHRIRYVVNKTERHGWKQNFQCLLKLSWGGKNHISCSAIRMISGCPISLSLCCKR